MIFKLINGNLSIFSTMQTTSHILMIRPVRFGYNEETAVNNAFQVRNDDPLVQEKALREFDQFVKVLRENGVDVTVINDSDEPHTPDSVFPNNWVSFHDDGSILLYPMYAVSRRRERKQQVLDIVAKKFIISNKTDLSFYEKENIFLEGTGSMVLDRDHKIAYACLSQRTDEKALTDFCKRLGYKPVAFTATDMDGLAIYHTNVMMCVGDKFVVICPDAIKNKEERSLVENTIRETGKKVIPISYEQMNHFAGNMLQVENDKKEKLLVMSSQAYESLNKEQVKILSGYSKIVHSPLTIIEKNGGGSARCMMAEIHLPVKNKSL
jgi:hypothetical protein